MSQINDALKKARDGRPKNWEPVPEVPPTPGENPPPGRPISYYVLPALAVVALVAGGFLLGKGFSNSDSEVKVRANTPAPTPVVSPPAALAPSKAAAVALTNSPAKTLDAVTGTADSAGNATTNPIAAADSPKPQPVTLHLQSIFYRAKNPSAVINGKTVSPGDRVSGARVLTIAKDSVTIITSTGQTNILDLD